MMMRISLLLSALMAVNAATPLRRRMEEDAQVDYSWMSGYTMKFQQCFQDSGANLVYFSLCPSENKCESGCEGGTEYVAEMLTFVDAFSEAQLGAREYACEMVREACEENGQDDDDNTCYYNAGMEYCVEDEDEFNVQEWMECAEWENAVENEDDENQYYVGPTCYEGKIYLGYFTDEDCTALAEDGAFETNNGYTLEYSAAAGYSIIEDECANCKEHGMDQDQNANDQEDEDDVLEQCEELYEASQNWEAVADKYEEEVVDVRASAKRTTKEIVWISIGAVLGFLAIVGCCLYAFKSKKSGVDKTPLVE